MNMFFQLYLEIVADDQVVESDGILFSAFAILNNVATISTISAISMYSKHSYIIHTRL